MIDKLYPAQNGNAYEIDESEDIAEEYVAGIDALILEHNPRRVNNKQDQPAE